MCVLVTGGAGFIGSNFILDWFAMGETRNESIINLDKLTYAGNILNLNQLSGSDRHIFIKGSIGNKNLVDELLLKYQPRFIVNFAAESHVDRSIISPEEFVKTNVVETSRLLESAYLYWSNLERNKKEEFRFLHVSTDEVYGELLPKESAFTEKSNYAPNNPYSASKAASDHMVRAWNHTYNLPTNITNCSNNYGPYHLPEKLIPLVITNALAGKKLPIYGDGSQVRDWLYVKDHCSAIRCVLAKGGVGETYNVGGNNEKTNLEVVNTLCAKLDEIQPRKDGESYARQIVHISDRLGHDKRYAINAEKISRELNWTPKESFLSGIEKTIHWYLENQAWVQSVQGDEYKSWLEKQYGNI